AESDYDLPFPAGSPVSPLLTIGDVNPKRDNYDKTTRDTLSLLILGNHNTYIRCKAFIDANRLVFGGGKIPQEIADMVGCISEVFVRENWVSYLNANARMLETKKRVK